MTIFLVPAFKDPTMVARLARALAPSRVVIHIDNKVDEAPFRLATRELTDTVEFITDRVVVNWSGYSTVRAIRNLVGRGLEIAESDDEYLVVTSGQDYPIKPPSALEALFSERRGEPFLRAFRVADSDDHYRDQWARRFYRDLPLFRRSTSDSRVRRVRNATIHGVERLARVAPKRRIVPGLVMAQGTTHFALTARCFRELERGVTHEMEKYFSSIFCPDEKFYHSLFASSVSLQNETGWSPMSYEGRGQWRYANLNIIDPSLRKVYTEDDWSEIAASDKFFVRKVESGTSGSLLDRIDAELLHRVP